MQSPDGEVGLLNSAFLDKVPDVVDSNILPLLE